MHHAACSAGKYRQSHTLPSVASNLVKGVVTTLWRWTKLLIQKKIKSSRRTKNRVYRFKAKIFRSPSKSIDSTKITDLQSKCSYFYLFTLARIV